MLTPSGRIQAVQLQAQDLPSLTAYGMLIGLLVSLDCAAEGRELIPAAELAERIEMVGAVALGRSQRVVKDRSADALAAALLLETAGAGTDGA